VLKPGDRLKLGHQRSLLGFQQPGRVRLRAHYVYSAQMGKHYRIRGLTPDRLGLMKDVPPFALTSDPIEFEVVRPLDVRVRVKRSMKANVEYLLSDILDMTAVNLTSGAVPFADPLGYPTPRVSFELDATTGGWPPSFYEWPSGRRSPFAGSCRNLPAELAAGSEVPLLGTDRLDGTWINPRPGTVRVRAVFRPGVRDSRAAIMSEWVEVKVEKPFPAIDSH
jgi:hypothetical protein